MLKSLIRVSCIEIFLAFAAMSIFFVMSPNELLILSSAIVLGFYLRFEDDSVESAKNVKQWNVKIISVSTFTFHEVKFAIILVLNISTIPK